MKLKNSTVLRDCLYNLMPDSGANRDYHKGMIVGIASLAVAMGMTLNNALEMIAEHTPVMARHELEKAMPECWQGSVKYKD